MDSLRQIKSRFGLLLRLDRPGYYILCYSRECTFERGDCRWGLELAEYFAFLKQA